MIPRAHVCARLQLLCAVDGMVPSVSHCVIKHEKLSLGQAHIRTLIQLSSGGLPMTQSQGQGPVSGRFLDPFRVTRYCIVYNDFLLALLQFNYCSIDCHLPSRSVPVNLAYWVLLVLFSSWQNQSINQSIK